MAKNISRIFISLFPLMTMKKGGKSLKRVQHFYPGVSKYIFKMETVGFKNCIFISDIYYFTKKSYSVKWDFGSNSFGFT